MLFIQLYPLDTENKKGYNGYNKTEGDIHMDHSEILAKIADLEKEISLLPAGSVSKKTMNGKEYYYHRVSSGGKRTEKFVPFEKLDDLRQQHQHNLYLQKIH